ncbi:MAG: outer membrane protein assembly factor BamD [Nitrospinota bacterium]
MRKNKASVVLLAALILSACATPEKKLETLKSFNKANLFYAKGKYDPAQKRYQSLLDAEPDSPFRIHALLGVADSYFMQKEYYLAVPMYQRFIELYPLDDRTPHAAFYEGMSYYLDLFKMERDQTNAREGLKAFKKFVTTYPNHAAVPFAREKIIELEERLAKTVYLIAKFYYGIDAFGACIGRVDDLLLEYPNSRFVPDALLLKGMSYVEEEAFKKAEEVFAQVSSEYPETSAGNSAKSKLKKLKTM